MVALESLQMSYLSYLGSHWMLFIIVVLTVIVLGAASWFLKNWKLAATAILVVCVGLAYQSANMEGYKRKVAEDAQAQVVILQKRLLTLNIVAQADAARQKADRDYIDKLEARSETPKNDSACLGLDAARRVRAIGNPKSVTAPLPTRRHPKLLPWRGGPAQ